MMGGFHMGGGWFWLILVIAILVVGFFMWQTYTRNGAASRSQEGYEKKKGRSKSAREIADERYANGEISREEYNTIIEDLERDHAAV